MRHTEDTKVKLHTPTLSIILHVNGLKKPMRNWIQNMTQLYDDHRRHTRFKDRIYVLLKCIGNILPYGPHARP